MLLKCLKIFQLTNSPSSFFCKSIQFSRSSLKRHHNTIITNIVSRSKETIKRKIYFKKNHLRTNVVFLLVLNSFKSIPEFFKAHSASIVQNCVQNCEYVLAHRLHRSQQMLNMYSKLWDELTLQYFSRILKSQLVSGRDKTVLLLCAAVMFNWNKERIPDEDILRYSAEMSLIEFLRDKRKACLKGSKRPADCDCPVCTETDSEWQSFVEEDDIVVWKREDVNHRGKGLYCYKMYARYEDVTAYDFLEAQIDLDYRRSWDTHAVTLRLVDSEPQTNSDVIYWETKWPKLFSNRDYVFKRRYRIDKKRNLIYLVNRITEHPSCPVLPSKQRVREYWSYMIIKPHSTFDQPGLEFSLTYFDNPGSNIPSSLTLWVTVTEMPDFLKKLRLAALGVAERRGGAPSPLASRDSSVLVADDAAVSRGEQESDSSLTNLLQGLRSTLFLF